MSYKPHTLFSGSHGEASVDKAGPVYLTQDLEELSKMFDPNSTHRIDENHPTAEPGGISKDHLTFTITNDYDNTEKSHVATAYAHATTTNANPHETKAGQIDNTAISGVVGTNVQATLEGLKSVADTKASDAVVSAHTSSTSNPHSVTKSQVGLGNVDNTSDANKPISTATQTALDTKETIADANLLIKNVTFNSATGQFTFTKQNNQTIVIDTDIEKIPGYMALVEEPAGSGTYYLILYDRQGGTELSRCPVTALFNAITVEDTATIDLTLTTTQDGKKKLTADLKTASVAFSNLDSAMQSRITTIEAGVIGSVTDTSTIDLTYASGNLQADVKTGSIGESQLSTEVKATLAGYAARAEAAATSASASESNASTYATNASTSATTAGTYASNAEQSKLDAQGYANNASTSATNAGTYANNAGNSATSAGTSATTATEKATLSESWAVGGTGTRTGEDTNNAKYWCEQAEQSQAGDMKKSVYSPNYTGELGVKPLSGTSDPTTATAGVVGQFYTNTLTSMLYQCTDATGGVYTWASVGGGNQSAEIAISTTQPTEDEVLWINPDGTGATIDPTPTSGSTNAVQSGGVYTFVQNIKTTIGTIDLSSTWTGSTSPYSQIVTISGATVTTNSKVDIQPSASVITQLISDRFNALYIENNDGILTCYAIGEKPTVSITGIQVSVTEVAQ